MTNKEAPFIHLVVDPPIGLTSHCSQAELAVFRRPDAVFDPIATMLKGWLSFADAHYAQHAQPLVTDLEIGPAWVRTGQAILELLDSDVAHLNCGAASAIIYHALTLAGFTETGMVDDGRWEGVTS